MDQPRVGSQVLFCLALTTQGSPMDRPATVTDVGAPISEDGKGGIVNLTVTTDGANDDLFLAPDEIGQNRADRKTVTHVRRVSVQFSAEARPGSWCWAPRPVPVAPKTPAERAAEILAADAKAAAQAAADPPAATG